MLNINKKRIPEITKKNMEPTYDSFVFIVPYCMKAINLLGLVLVVLTLFVFRPVKYDAPDLAVEIIGVVEDVHTPCCGDIEIDLKNDDRQFYVNRALYNGEDIEEWQAELVGQKIKLEGVRHFSLLNLNEKIVPIKALEMGEQVWWSRDQQSTSL